jgi:ribosomal protein S18 acetylase RimI-like enzyme
MKFIIGSCESLNVSDEEIFVLLSQVYVQAGFTSAETAKTVFDPAKVRDRGILFASREASKNEFCGMVIVVPPNSKAIVRAKENECEMHLLGVNPGYRGHGLGRMLVNKTVEFAENNNWSKIILWTQKPMKEAQRLYESSGFIKAGEMTKSGIEFLVYERKCT